MPEQISPMILDSDCHQGGHNGGMAHQRAKVEAAYVLQEMEMMVDPCSRVDQWGHIFIQKSPDKVRSSRRPRGRRSRTELRGFRRAPAAYVIPR